MIESYDIKPYSSVASFNDTPDDHRKYDISIVAPIVGMSESFIKKVIGNNKMLTESMVIELLNQDAFSETFIPRSKIIQYLRNHQTPAHAVGLNSNALYAGDAIDLITTMSAYVPHH